jgi:multiple sugar transport system substrate-binding protein
MVNIPNAEQAFLGTLKPYLEQHKEINVKVKALDWTTAWNDITAAMSQGKGPDIVQLGTTWVPAIAAMNELDDLSARVGEAGGPDAYFPASWQSVMLQGRPNVYAVPWFVEARAMYYRKDAFQKAGIDPAAAFDNWQTFETALKKVNGVVIDGKPMSAFGIPGKNDWNVQHNIVPWIWGAGGEMLTPDRRAAAFNDEKALEGIMFYTGLVREGVVDKASLEKNTGQIESGFADGQTAVISSGPWMIKNFETPKEQGGFADSPAAKHYGVAPMPAGPKQRVTFTGGSDLAVWKGSRHKEAAWNLIAYLTSDEAQLSYAEKIGMLPARKSVMNSAQLMKEPGYAAFAEALKYGKSYPALPQWGAIETELVQSFSGIWDIVGTDAYSREAVQQRLNAAASDVNILLKQ